MKVPGPNCCRGIHSTGRGGGASGGGSCRRAASPIGPRSWSDLHGWWRRANLPAWQRLTILLASLYGFGQMVLDTNASWMPAIAWLADVVFGVSRHLVDGASPEVDGSECPGGGGTGGAGRRGAEWLSPESGSL